MKVMLLLISLSLCHVGGLETASDVTIETKMHDQAKILKAKEEDCIQRIFTEPTSPPSGIFCPMVWDGALCWPYSAADSVVRLSCPDYVTGFIPEKYATKMCLVSGNWFISDDTNSTWTNYSDCSTSNVVHTVIGMDSQYNNSRMAEYIPVIKLISRIGYSVSLTFLLVALFIMTIIKKLRCPRNNLHMHLFVSFIMRAFMALLKDNIFVEGVGLATHVVFINGSPDYFKDHDSWECKLVTSLWQYFIMANYCWILMEGLYLHNLIFLALFSDTSGICLYAALGWGLPVLSIVPWVIVKVKFENTICWTLNENEAFFWIIRGPITLSIVINFFTFLNVTRILFLKLTSSHGPDSRKQRYKKLAKSTLVLVPLFGVHYTVFLIMPAISENQTTELVWLICDQFFTSFQGFFVAVLYCFMNGEVQGEMRKKWERWCQQHSRSGRSSIITQSLTYFSRTRNSTTHSAGDLKDEDLDTGDKLDNRQSPAMSPYIPRTTDFSSCTSTYAVNPSPSPCLGRSRDYNSGQTPPESNCSVYCDKSPPVEEEPGEPPTALTPMLNGTTSPVASPTDFPKRRGENLGLLYMERMESVDLGESAV